MPKEETFGTEAEVPPAPGEESSAEGADSVFSLPSSSVPFRPSCSVPQVKSSKLCSVSPCCSVLQVMLRSVERGGGLWDR